jgi:SAM-dependent methyltransferase
MNVPSQKDAWNSLYGKQPRPWKGVPQNITFPFPANGKILDVGCGNGKTSSALLDAGYEVIGIDVSEAAVEVCKILYGDKMDVICASAASVPLPDGSMDGAVLVHVLEHLDDDVIKDTIIEIRRILRPCGKIFVRVFSKSDMRYGKGETADDNVFIRGNGIRYRYFDENELRTLFSGFAEVSSEHIEERTKFRETRSRIEAVFERTA